MTVILIGAFVLAGIVYGFLQWALTNVAHEIPGLHDIDSDKRERK